MRRALALFVLTMSSIIILSACGAFRSPSTSKFGAVPQADAATVLEGIEVYWIGHATALIRIDDKWILTDPVFSDRVGGFAERYVAPGIAMDELPHLDAVLISHAHMDHLDVPSLLTLESEADLVVPPGVMTSLPAKLPFESVRALSSWRSVTNDGLRITAVPARHANGRWLVDALWMRDAHAGFVLEYHGHTVYFAGDTAAGQHFDAIGDKFDIDVALLPVGPAKRPPLFRHFRKRFHLNPTEALAAFEQLRARWMIPIHWGTFFHDADSERPILARAVRASKHRDRVRVLAIGQSVAFAPTAKRVAATD